MSGRILVVEDDPVTALLMKSKLEREYFQVVGASTAAEAISILYSQPVDVAVLDIILPDRNGFDLCREIKASPRLAHLPVIISTSLKAAEDRLRGFESGADEFLTKPVNEDILIARIKNLVRVKQSMDELRRRVEDMSRSDDVSIDYRRYFDQRGRVLFVEEQFSRAHELGALINRFADVDIELDPATAIHTASETSYDCILISFSMESKDPVRICSQIRSIDALRSTPILAVVDNHDDQKRVIRALEIGASDYLELPVDPAEMQVRLKTQISRKRQQDQLKSNLQSEIELAVIDQLTGLHNRRYLDRRLPLMFEDAKKEKMDLSLILIDIDHFKKINDSYGHDAGDKILAEVARRLEATTRQHDMVCRFGGEEFIVVLPDCSLRMAQKAAERLRAAIEKDVFLADIYGKKIKASVSLGVAANNISNEDSAAFIRRADQALYRAKRDGRNRVVADAA